MSDFDLDWSITFGEQMRKQDAYPDSDWQPAKNPHTYRKQERAGDGQFRIHLLTCKSSNHKLRNKK